MKHSGLHVSLSEEGKMIGEIHRLGRICPLSELQEYTDVEICWILFAVCYVCSIPRS